MLKKCLTIFICVFLLSESLNAEETDNSATINDLTIIVSSCDKYVDCWKPFCTLLQRYWPGLQTHNKHIPVILITNEMDFSFPGIQVFKTGKDKSWSDNMLAILKTVTTKKVLYLQEDYFFTTNVNEQMMKTYVDALDTPDIGYVELTQEGFFGEQPLYQDYKNAALKPRFVRYRTSLQPAIWRKDIFEWLILPGENPWAFEIDGSARSDGSFLKFLYITKDYPFEFMNACQGGFMHQDAVDLLKKENIPFLNPKLPINTDYPFTTWLRLNYPETYEKRWLKILRYFDPKFRKN